jgi:hypothetical protein
MRNDPAPDIAWFLANGKGFVYCQTTELGMDDITGVGIWISEGLVDARAKLSYTHQDLINRF